MQLLPHNYCQFVKVQQPQALVGEDNFYVFFLQRSALEILIEAKDLVHFHFRISIFWTWELKDSKGAPHSIQNEAILLSEWVGQPAEE